MLLGYHGRTSDERPLIVAVAACLLIGAVLGLILLALIHRKDRLMHTIYFALYLAGAVCFLLAAANLTARVNLVALGLLFWVCVPLLVTARAS